MTERERGERASRRPVAVREVVGQARAQFEEAAGRRVAAVSGVERDADGYRVTLEVVELERIPDSTSVMATYEVTIDGGGELTEFFRSRRYYRNRADADDA